MPVCVAASSQSCGGLVGAGVAYVGFSQPDANSDGALVGQPGNCDPAIYECCNGYPCTTVANAAFNGDVAAVAFGVANTAFQGDGGADGGDGATDGSRSSDASEDDEGSFFGFVADVAFSNPTSDGSFGDAGLDADVSDGSDE